MYHHAIWYVGSCLHGINIYNCMSSISAYLFSLCFYLESQFAMNISGPGLYMILTLYVCILSRIHCNLCDGVATSFLNTSTRSL